MIFDWYKIINRFEFEASGLVSKEVSVVLEGIGLKTILVTQGNALSLVYEGVMVSLGVTTANPFIFEGHAIFQEANGDIWLGVETDAD